MPGEGIGLAHARALAIRLGGMIDVHSKLGEGATFRVSLPIHFNAMRGPQFMNAHQAVTIVMVEDDEGHARLIEKNIRRAGIFNDIKHFLDGSARSTICSMRPTVRR